MSGISNNKQLKRTLADRRWVILAALVFIIVIIEGVEYGLVPLQKSHFFNLAEVILFTVVLPAVSLLMLWQINRSETEQRKAMSALDNHNFLTSRMARSSRWDELSEAVAMLPSDFYPSGQSWLFLSDPQNHQFVATLGIRWQDGTKTIEHSRVAMSEAECQPILALKGFSSLANPPSSPDRLYYLPLHDNQRAIGFLKLLLPARTRVTDGDRALFDSLVTDILLTASNILLRNSMSTQIANSDEERKRIAQDLHDTLGQNLGYLRLRLDQMTTGDAILAVTTIRQELERMRDIADEAYQQMRATLDDLQPASQANLAAALMERAQAIAQRGGFCVRLRENGEPVLLPAGQKRQVAYICQEALVNIEKHARATEVDLVLDWQEADLSIKIIDNGRGFDAAVLDEPGHYGLLIMQERAQNFNGDLKVASSIGQGTRVTLTIPLAQPKTGDGSPLVEPAFIELAQKEDQ